jgi:hypothetical protein
MDITKKTDIELKALAFDMLKSLEGLQNNIRIINQELAKREVPKADEPAVTK